jgi:signal peptidase I
MWMLVPVLQLLLYRSWLPLWVYFSVYPLLMVAALTQRYWQPSSLSDSKQGLFFPLMLMIAMLLLSNGLVQRYIGQLYQVQSLSMAPAIRRHDVVKVVRISPLTRALFAQPERQYIPVASRVLFYSPQRDQLILKRIVAVAGDTVAFNGNQLWINGAKVTAVISKKNNASTVYRQQLSAVIFSIIENDRGKGLRGDTVVPAGHYFVMGDNRDNSVDSREFGSIDQRHIIGVVN